MARRLPEGTEKRRANGYVYVKRGHGWFLKGRDYWQRNIGVIPQHHVITYLDGDPDNCDPENLRCVSRSEMLAVNRNFKRGDEPEITKLQFIWCGLDQKKREAFA